MQELVIDRVERKMPKKEGGNPFYVVYGQAGEEMTTFDEALYGFGKGTRLNVEPKVNGRHVNITDWALLEEVKGTGPAPGGAPPGGGGSYKKDVDGLREEYRLKAGLVARERASIEAQTVYNGAVAVITCPGGYDSLPAATKDALHELIREAIKWGKARFTAAPVPPAAPEPEKESATAEAPKQAPPAGGNGLPEFKTGVELVNYALKHGYTVDKLRPLGLDKPTEIKDVGAATKVLFGTSQKAAPAKDPNDPDGLFQ